MIFTTYSKRLAVYHILSVATTINSVLFLDPTWTPQETLGDLQRLQKLLQRSRTGKINDMQEFLSRIHKLVWRAWKTRQIRSTQDQNNNMFEKRKPKG